jgi:hypothetical protein
MERSMGRIVYGLSRSEIIHSAPHTNVLSLQDIISKRDWLGMAKIAVLWSSRGAKYFCIFFFGEFYVIIIIVMLSYAFLMDKLFLGLRANFMTLYLD